MMTDATATMNDVNGENTQLYWHESTVTTAIAVVMTETMVMMNEDHKEQCVRQSMGMDSKMNMAKAS